jgi:hypothetical protein
MGTHLFIVPFAKPVRVPKLVCNSGLRSRAPQQQFGAAGLFTHSKMDLLVSDAAHWDHLVVGDRGIHY